MSRIRNRITVATGAAAGLFLAALASSATATANPGMPVNPGLPGVVDQLVASSASLPQQLLQTTASTLTGSPLSPAAQSPAPIATATLNMPQTPAALAQGASPVAGVPSLPGPGNLASVLPFPLPSLGGNAASVAAPAAGLPGLSSLPGALLPSLAGLPAGLTAGAPAVTSPVSALLIPGLP